MRYPPIDPAKESHVPADFATSTSSFDLPGIATFADLADRLSRFGEHHDAPLTGIRIKADPSVAPRSMRTAMLRRLADAGEEISRLGF